MEVSHTPVDKPTPRDVCTVLQDLPQRVSALLKQYESSNTCEFEDFERELHAVFGEAECAVTAEALARQDVDLPHVLIDGEMHRRACRYPQTYLSAAGPVTVARTLYRARVSGRWRRWSAGSASSRDTGRRSPPVRAQCWSRT